MNPSFQIQSSRKNHTGQSTLFIELSMQCISYLVLYNDTECTSLGCYHLPEDTTYDKAAALLKQIVNTQKILQADFQKINIVYAYPYSLLVPHQFTEGISTKEMFELVYGDVEDDVIMRSDFMYRHNLHNIYSIPKQVDAVVAYLFSADVSTHQYSLLPDAFRQKEGNHLYCIVAPGALRILFIKEGKLQVIQTYGYKTPEDVAYQLLNCCKSFETEVDDTVVHLHGMIDENSMLYKELFKYFLQLEFATLPDTYTYPEEINKYPAHYFSHLFSLASCV